jgi:hypothetical protein
MIFHHRDFPQQQQQQQHDLLQQNIPPKLPPKRKDNFYKIPAEVNENVTDRNDLPYIQSTSSFV